MTTDEGVNDHIAALVAEEKSLRDRLASGDITPDEEHHRLRALEVQLDQSWDLLRQRRALRESGGTPDDAAERDAAVVESYLE
jgi:hypothetical protein